MANTTHELVASAKMKMYTVFGILVSALLSVNFVEGGAGMFNINYLRISAIYLLNYFIKFLNVQKTLNCVIYY